MDAEQQRSQMKVNPEMGSSAIEQASPSLTATAHQDSLADYAKAGVARAQAIGCRGPVRYDNNGRLHQEIMDAYWQHGFYIFEGIIDAAEIELLRQDMDFLLEHAPTGKDSTVDAQGRAAYGSQFQRSPYTFVKPLSDPWGGTDVLGGRHPTKMMEPSPSDDAPQEVVHIIQGMCQTMPSGLRLYGHPDLLAIAADINGDDFAPYNDATFVKQAGLGGSVSWHQDGVTHWEAENWDEGIHGFNFQAQLYKCTEYNCLWVLPGTHKNGRIDIKTLIAENGGSEQLPGAVPLLCQPGDVTIANRQLLHGSFANSSPDMRISMTFGFHRYTSVLGARGALSQSASEVYDAQRIFDRAAVIQLAIDARQQFYPEESAYKYHHFLGKEEQFRMNPENEARYLKDYVLRDLSI